MPSPALPHPLGSNWIGAEGLQGPPLSSLLAPPDSRPVVLSRKVDILFRASSGLLRAPGPAGTSPDVLGAVTQSLHVAGLSASCDYCSLQPEIVVHQKRLTTVASLFLQVLCRGRCLYPP